MRRGSAQVRCGERMSFLIGIFELVALASDAPSSVSDTLISTLISLFFMAGLAWFLFSSLTKKRKKEREWVRSVEEGAPVVVKTYEGTQSQATERLQGDVASMAAMGYFPTNQSWAPTRQNWIILFGIFGQPTGGANGYLGASRSRRGKDLPAVCREGEGRRPCVPVLRA